MATYTDDAYWPLNTTLFVTDFKGNDPRFVYYVLDSIDFGAFNSGGAIPSLNRNYLTAVRVPSVPLTVQRKIAAILSAHDDLVENNNRRIKVLEEIAQRIYHEWFVEFRYPGHEGVRLVSSELGMIPEDWEISRLADVADLVRGRSYRSAELVETGGVPFVNLKCMARGGGFRRDGLKRYVGMHDPDQRVTEGDIVLAVTDLTQQREILARATLVPRLDEAYGVISLDVARIVPHDASDRLALLYTLLHTDFASRVAEFANGSTVLHLSPTHVAEGHLVWPNERLRRMFVKVVAPMVNEINKVSQASEVSRSARDLLLPRLISGDIDVSNLDIALPAA